MGTVRGPSVLIAHRIPSIKKEPDMDHTLHPRLEAAELNAANLEGITVYGPQDDNVGTISHLHGHGAETLVIIDIGGFLGIGTKAVALRLSELDVMREENGEVHATTALTRDNLDAMPEHL